MRREREPKEQKPTWTVEEFYFGNANYPSWAIYRNSGERLQRQIEMPLPLTPTQPDGAQYETPLDELNPWSKIGVTEFLGTYQDCKLVVQDGYDLGNGDHQKPHLWLIGWQEVTTPKGRQTYEQDKIAGTWETKPKR